MKQLIYRLSLISRVISKIIRLQEMLGISNTVLARVLVFSLPLLLLVYSGSLHSESIHKPKVKPLDLILPSGSIDGGQLLFINVEEPLRKRGKTSIICQFGSEPLVIGNFDPKTQHYLCQVPAHSRPEAVQVTIVANSKEFKMSQPYIYTTHGKYDAPVTQLDIKKLQQRTQWVKRRIPKFVKLCAVLKNGNPTGWLGKAMEATGKVDYFCVPRIQDGIALRKAGVKKPIMIMYLTKADFLPLLLHYKLEPAAFSQSWVEQVNRMMKDTNSILKIHLWVDTGISREGVMPDEALPLAREIHKSRNLHLQGIATHFCCLDEDDVTALRKKTESQTKDAVKDSETVSQKLRFDKIVNEIHAEGIGLNAIIHASSGDGLRYGLRPIYYDMLRVGTLLFENPNPKSRNYSWKTTILQIKKLPKGWCIDYGCEERVEKDSIVGLVSHIPDDEVTYTIRGKEVEKLLDHEVVVVLDISELPDVEAGEEVTMIFSGDDSPLDTSYSAPTTLIDK